MKREKPSYIPLFPDSYLADTTHLTTEQHGAYMLLLMAAWRSADCSLIHDEARLAKLAGIPVAKWRKVGPAVMEMWTCEGGRCWQKRLRHEWAYVQDKRQKARHSVAVREANRSNGRSSNDASNDEHLVGGGGGGGQYSPSHYHEEGLVEGTNPTRGFSVLPGGRQ